MSESSRPISPGLAYLFLACALMNFGGALPDLLLAAFFVWLIARKR